MSGVSQDELPIPKFTVRRARSREELLADDPLAEFFVWWNDVSQGDVQSFAEVLASAKSELPLQKYLEGRPMILVQPLTGGHGRWVIPQKKLGSEHVTDFVIGERSSLGFERTAVELESPIAPIFNKKGDPTKYLTHALRQINDWRSWLKNNQNYAARPKREQGLGLTNIDANLPGLIIIGRESDLDPDTTERRREWSQRMDIKIHTYDWLLRIAAGKA